MKLGAMKPAPYWVGMYVFTMAFTMTYSVLFVLLGMFLGIQAFTMVSISVGKCCQCCRHPLSAPIAKKCQSGRS